MIHTFKKMPKIIQRQTVSFSDAQVKKVCFNDDVEIVILDNKWKEVSRHTYDGFTFINSLIKKTLPDGKEYWVFKL